MMWTAFLLGLGGSLHCAGMCSPLVMSVSKQSKKGWGNRLVYNVGRIGTYAVLGLFVASIGALVNLAVYQHVLTVVLGALLILIGLGTVSSLRIPLLTTVVNKFLFFIKVRFASLLHQKNYAGLFLMGVLNGLLPCGLTYTVLSFTLTLASAWEGFLFMAVFGLGTFPVMMALPIVLQYISRYVTISAARITTVAMISVGVLLISRTLIVHQHPLPATIVKAEEPIICR
jgi:uncharacterized protein